MALLGQSARGWFVPERAVGLSPKGKGGEGGARGTRTCNAHRDGSLSLAGVMPTTAGTEQLAGVYMQKLEKYIEHLRNWS